MDFGLNRRGFLTVAGQTATAALASSVISVRDYKAVGDGKTDDTAAIQQAIDVAARTKATVHIPEGVFCCSTLKVPPHVGLSGNSTWDYHGDAGSTLRLCDKSASCLIDITGAFGVRLTGLELDGKGLGSGVHGVLLNKPDYGRREDTIFIEGCRIGNFTGDGIHLARIWLFTIRHNMVCHNRGNGLWFRGWDGFVLDNWFSGNREAGIGAYEENASCTITGNRIEWNGRGGLIFRGGSHYNINGNYFDRSGGPAISLLASAGTPCKVIALAGNCLYRSGAPNWGTITDPHLSTHVRFEGVRGISFTGNTMNAGRDDGGGGSWSPDYAMVLKDCAHTVLADNTMFEAALKELVLDLGGHGEGFIQKENVGSLWHEKKARG